MSTTKTAGVSLAQLDARKASEKEFWFPFLIDGEETGIELCVIGGQAKRVTDEVHALINEQRKRAAVAEMQAKLGNKKNEVVFTPFEEDIDFSNRNSALRLTGWRGIIEPFTPELGLLLCESNKDARVAVLTASDRLSNFMKLSPPA